MKRRQFLASTAAAGTGIYVAPFSLNALNFQESLSFLTGKGSPQMLFPTPPDGFTLGISPPGLAWYPAPNAAGYRVEIKKDNGPVVYQKDIPPETVHLPDRILHPGKYNWNIHALDKQGKVSASRGEKSFIISENPDKLPWISPTELLSRVPKDHSRVIFLKPKMAEFKHRLSTTHQSVLDNLVKQADVALTIGLPPFPEYHRADDPAVVRMGYSRYFPLFRKYIDGAMTTLAKAWLFTGEKRYADASKAILLEISGWPQDYDNVTSIGAKWGDEPGLSYSRWGHKVYDWLYDTLTPSEKDKVFRMCEARAWHTHRRLTRANYLTTPGESHNGRLIAYLAEMAVALAHESEGAETWLEYSLKALTTIYPHWGGIEGGWAEGIPYGLWYNGFYIAAFDTLLETTGYNLWQRPFFSKIRYFYMYCASPRGEIRPFGDSAEGAGPGVPGGGEFGNLINYHAQRFNDPHALWWVNQTYGWEGSTDEQSLLFPADLKPTPPADLPNSRIFRGVGWAGLHSNLSDPENDTFFLFKSSPYGSVSHSHGDQNAFAVMKGGVALAIPSGYYGPSYGQPHHANWTRSTKANNCILVNGTGQVLRSDKASGKIAEFEDKAGYTYLLGDAAMAYDGRLTRFNRHVLFLRPGIILMLDDLEAPEKSAFQWMLHAFEAMKTEENKIVSQRRGARLTAWVQSQHGIIISQTNQFDTPFNEGIPKEFHLNKPDQWHVTAETTEKSETCRIASVLAVDTLSDQVMVRVLSQEGWFGVSATGSFGEVEGWLCLEPGSKAPNGYAAGGDSLILGKDRSGKMVIV